MHAKPPRSFILKVRASSEPGEVREKAGLNPDVERGSGDKNEKCRDQDLCSLGMTPAA